MFKSSLFLILVLFTTPARAFEDVQGNIVDAGKTGWHEISLQHNKLTRYFRIYRPENLKEMPAVVFVLHGGKQSMRKIFEEKAGGSQEWQTLAEKGGFLLIAPNAVNVKSGDTNGDKQNWNDCRLPVKGNGSASTADDVGFIDTLIDWSHDNYHTNMNRIYVTGASNGGMMAFRAITELGYKFAAAAVFIANQPEHSDCVDPKYPVPLMIMNGTHDSLVLWHGGKIRKQGVNLLSAENTLQFWSKVNKLNSPQRVTNLPDLNKHDGSYIVKHVFPANDSGSAELWFYKVKGGGHTMPSIKHNVSMLARWLVGKQNKDLEATHEAWNFMNRHTTKEKVSVEDE